MRYAMPWPLATVFTEGTMVPGVEITCYDFKGPQAIIVSNMVCQRVHGLNSSRYRQCSTYEIILGIYNEKCAWHRASIT